MIRSEDVLYKLFETQLNVAGVTVSIYVTSEYVIFCNFSSICDPLTGYNCRLFSDFVGMFLTRTLLTPYPPLSMERPCSNQSINKYISGKIQVIVPKGKSNLHSS